MDDLRTEDREKTEESRTVGSLERLDEDLEIMERHSRELERIEEEIQQSMRKWDREYKDSCLHSTPKPQKHTRY